MNLPKLLMRQQFGKRLPITSCKLHLPGVEKLVMIHRDRYGIPNIEVQTHKDAYYALGFCQGRDRSFQLEMLFRHCRGTLAELVGELGLTMDRLARRIGFFLYGSGHFNAMEPEYQLLVQAFALGITDGATPTGTGRPSVGGQSGNRFSPHYDDLLQFWLHGEGIKMPWTEEAIRNKTAQTVQLNPT